MTVSAVEDADAATDAAVTITHTVGSTGDYNGETAADVAVTIAETGTPAPALTLAFEAAAHNDVDASGDVTLSDVLTYTATATNSGNVPLAEVTVSDLLVNAGGVECASLDLGGECELTGDYTVTQADVDAGEVTNTAAAVASGVSEQTASRTTEVAQEKALTLAKTATTGSFGSVGDRIAYSYEATNSGTVTLTGALTIADDRIPASGITCPAVPAAGLGPGASVTCAGSYTVVQADVDASQVTNKATAMLDGMQSNEATATVQRPQVAGEAPTVSVGGISSPEDAGHLDFAVTLDKASAQTATVVFGTTDGTAVAGIDYADTTGTLTFAPGTTSRTVAVRIEDDDVDEENETFTLVLSDAVNANLPALSGTGLGTIRDDDTRGVTVAPEALSVTENGSATYAVALDSEPTDEVTVTVSVPANSELSVDKPSLTFTTGNWNTAQTMTVSADDDDDAVADDVVTIGHSASGGDYNNESASVEVTIVEDDTPTLSIADRRAAESDGTIGFSVTLSIESSEQVTVDYVTSNGTGAGAATAGEDYTARSATLHFPANSTTPQTISIPITDDSVDEEEETFTVTLSNASNAALAGGQETLEAAGTIEDDDATPTAVRLSVDPEKMSEGAGATDVAVTATLEGDSRLPGDTDVAVTVSDGTAGSADYTATEAMVRIPAGEQSGTGTVRLTPVDDTLDEDDETVVVNGSAGTLTVSSATLTIEDDDATPGLSIGEDVSVAEGGTATFTVTLGAAIGREVTVDWATSDGTATAGEDYAAVTDGRITFSPGGALSQTIGVTVSDDQVDEANETFTVALSNAVNAQVETGKESATGTIEDDDERGVTVAPEALSVTENSSATYTVALDSEPTAEVTVGVAVPPNSELSVDKTTLRFTADNWNTAQQIEVSAADDDDAVADAAATVGHSASGGDYNGQTAEVEVTIVEDDTPTLSIADRSAAESDGTMAFAVTLSVASSNEVTVAYATSNGTGPEAATAGEDYTEANGTLAFPANSTAPQTISVSIANDAVDEAVETFAVTLSNVQQASLAGGGSTLSAAGTITDDDERGVTVSETQLDLAEGGSGIYTVVLTSEPTADVTVNVTVPQGTDVSVDKTSLTFTAGDWNTAQTVTVGAAGDADAVDDAAVTISHSVSSTGDYGGETAADVEVTIAESDTPTLSIADESVAEDAGTVTFTVTLSVASSNEVTVAYATSNGTGPGAATAGEDYTEANGALTFPANSAAAQTIRVPITDDDVDEANETFTVTLSAAQQATLSGGQATLAATGTITDDDARGVTVTPTALTVEEGGSGTYAVVLTSQPTADVTVDVTVPQGTDVSVDKTSLTFTSDDWETAQTVTVGAAGDDDAVVDDAVTITHAVSSAGDYAGETAADVEVRIAESDTPTLSIADESVAEDAVSATFTVTLSVASSNEVTVKYATSNGTGPEAATAGEDYTEADGTLTFPANSAAPQTIRVPITDDDLDEADEETFTLTLHSAAHADLAGGGTTLAAAGTITDDDDPPAAGIADAGASEGDGGITFTVSLETASARVVTVDWATAADAAAVNPATADADYTAANGTLSFPAQSTERTIRVLLVDDDAVEESETFKVELSNARYATLQASAAAAVGTIADDDVAPPPGEDPPTPGEEPPTPGEDPPPPKEEPPVTRNPEVIVFFGAADYEAAEGGSAAVTVRLSADPERRVTIPLTRTHLEGAADGDYSGVPANVAFAAGETSQEFAVTAVDDAVDDDGEAVVLGFGALPSGVAAGEPATAAVALADDDVRGVTVRPEALNVPEGGSGSYTVVLDTEPTAEVTVLVAAPSASELSLDETSLTFAPAIWSRPQTVTVRAAEDADAMADDPVTLIHAVRGGDYEGVPAAPVEVKIIEDDAPTLAVAGGTAAEGEGAIEFAVTLSLASSSAVTVEYATSDVSAMAGADYQWTAGILTLPAGTTEAAIRVRVVDDDIDEADETFRVLLSNAVNAVVGDGEAFGEIADDDLPVVEIAADRSAVEEGGTAAFTLTRAGDLTGPLTVPVRVAERGVFLSDGVPSAATFAAGAATAALEAATTEDAVDEADGAVTAAILGAASHRVGASARAVVTVADNDVRGVRVSTTALTLPEGGAGTYTVTLETEPTGEVTIRMKMVSEDLTVTPPMLSFSPMTWDAPQTVTVRAAEDADAVLDPAVTLTHAVSGGDYGGVPASPVEVRILEDDAPVLAVAGGAAAEGDGEIEFAVTLSVASSSEVTVEYATAEGTARAGEDFEPATGTLTFPAGATSATIRVPVLDDDVDEADETFTVRLSHAVNAAVGDGEAFGEIADDDLPVVEIAAEPAALKEGGTATFTLTRAGDLTGPLSVPVGVTQEGEYLSGTAPSSVRFAAGAATAAFAVATENDDRDEEDGAVAAEILGAASHRAGASARAAVPVADDDVRGVRLSATSLTVAEGGRATYTVVLTSEPDAAVTVAMAVPSGTDLTVVPSELTFAAATWEAPRTVTVRADQDADAVSDDPAAISHVVGGGDYEGLSAAGVEVTIAEDDVPVLAVAGGAAAEGDGEIEFAVTLSLASSSEVTVEYATAEGTARAGEDFEPAAGTLTFPAGATAATIRVPVVDDDVDEAAETFTVRLSQAVNAAVGDGEAAGEIADDDLPVVEIAAEPAALKEGGTATFTLTRAGDLAVPLSVPVRVGELGAFLSGTAPSPVAFAAGAATAAFAVATEDDAVDEADGAVTAEIIGGDGHRAGAAARATVAVADDDVRGVRILETALTIREGGSGLCPVVLTSEPTAPVTFSAVMPAGAEITMAPPALRFTPANWSQKQVVTVRALHDADAVADDPLVLAHTVKGGDYEGLAAPVVTVTITEDDVSGVKVSETALTLAEGDAGTYTVVLDTEPAAEVTVAVEVPEGAEITTAPSQLTFTTETWNTEQTVTVTAIQDADAVADLPVTLAHEVSGGDYQGLAAAGVEVTIAEDDVPGVKVSETALTLAEGDAGTYTVVLDTEPAAEVTVAVEVPSGTDLTVTPSELRFTAADWNTAQTVTVTAIQDADAVADLPVTLAHEVSGGDYQGLAAAGVEVTIAEDDVPGVKVSETALTLAEGDAGTYTVVLDTEPAAEVTVAVEVPSGTDLTVTPSELRFTAADWNTAQR